MPAGAMRTPVDVERAVAGRILGEASGGLGCINRRVEDFSAARAKDEVGAAQSPSGRGDVPHGGFSIEVGPGRPSIDATIPLSRVISGGTSGA
jgi:hypothetical protein